MAAFNAERYLAEAVASILAQTMRDFEFIIVDDGSTDRTPELLHQFAGQDPRVKILRQANRGLTCSLNAAARTARGELLARMDADDIAEPDRFERQASFLSQPDDCVALGTSLVLIDPDGETLAEQIAPIGHEAILDQLLHGKGAIPHSSAMIRRSAFEKVGGYREQFAAAQDLDLWLRLADIGRLANLPEPLLRYRLHADSVTTRKRELQLSCAQQAVREARRRLGDPYADAFQIQPPPPSNRARIIRSWARMALKSHRTSIARKHAWSAFRQNPWWPAHWFLLARTLWSKCYPQMPQMSQNTQMGPHKLQSGFSHSVDINHRKSA